MTVDADHLMPPTRIGPAAQTSLRESFAIARRQHLVGLSAGLAWRAAAIAAPWALQRAIDDGVIADDRTSLVLWSVVLMLLGVVSWAGDVIRHLAVERGAYSAMIEIRRRLVERIVNGDPEQVARMAPGEVTARAVDDAMRIRIWVSGSVTGLIAAMTLVVVVVLVSLLDPLLAVIAIAVVPLVAALAVSQASVNLRAALASVTSAGETSAWLESSIAGVETVKGLGAEPVVVGRAAERAAVGRETNVGLAKVRGRWLAAAAALPALGAAVGVVVGGLRAIDGEVSAGQIVAFTGWMALLTGATTTLTARLALRGTALAAAERLSIVLAIADHPSATSSGRDTSAPIDGRRDLNGSAGAEVIARDLSIERGGRPLLRHLDLVSPAGSFTAIVGPTGSGKSSVLAVIAGELRPAHGSVTIDGRDLATIGWPARSGIVSLVPQAPTAATGSLADVMRRGAPSATDAELVELLGALELRSLFEDIGGLDGRIGERGRTVSGGQRQRLALAAAILRQPSVLLLDDATSALDEDVERAALDALRQFLPHTTIIAATHRDEPVRRADRVIDLTPFVVPFASTVESGR